MRPLPSSPVPSGEQCIELTEWQRWSSADTAGAAPVELEASPEVRGLASRLHAQGKLRVSFDWVKGLCLGATSYVGTVRLGNLRVVIRPKLEGAPLLALFRYAYGLRDLELLSPVSQALARSPFQELLILQLVMEARELLRRGLHRRYVRRDEVLASPRGRIDLGWWMKRAGSGQAALRCTHHPRLEDCLVNQVLRSGLRLGERLAEDAGLRAELHRLEALLDGVAPVPLRLEVLARLAQDSDRMTAAYRPALALIRLLREGQGSTEEDAAHEAALPGFLFDMNRFFQALLARLLRESLPGWSVHEEYPLRGLLGYAEGANPRRCAPPLPRPDFAILEGGRVRALLDAKYRDLWEEPLPREMLYQLAVYAWSQGRSGRAAILYPTMNAQAAEQVIELRDTEGAPPATVVLRPLHLPRLAALVSQPESADVLQERRALASALAGTQGV